MSTNSSQSKYLYVLNKAWGFWCDQLNKQNQLPPSLNISCAEQLMKRAQCKHKHRAPYGRHIITAAIMHCGTVQAGLFATAVLTFIMKCRVSVTRVSHTRHAARIPWKHSHYGETCSDWEKCISAKNIAVFWKMLCQMWNEWKEIDPEEINHQ